MELTSYYKKNIDLDKTDTANKITRYVYSVIEKEPVIKNVLKWSDIDHIKNRDYTVCIRYAGTPSWIVFVSIDDVCYAVTFPKLSRKHQTAKLFPIELKAKGKMYQGTVMEGIYTEIEGTKILTVYEVYMFAGEKQLLKNKSSRLKDVGNLLKTYVTKQENYALYVSQSYDLNRDGLTALHKRIQDDGPRQFRDLLFYPETNGQAIYMYTILDLDREEKIIIIDIFEIHRTSQPDVYHLHKPRGPKIGLAYLPTITDSKKCKQWFKEHPKKKLLVKCTKTADDDKWIPSELIHN